jgi:hypothetical protein
MTNMGYRGQSKPGTMVYSAEGFKEYLQWVEQEMEKSPKARGKHSCACIASRVNPSWASKTHGVIFHVCGEHANQYTIPQGPYKKDTAMEFGLL